MAKTVQNAMDSKESYVAFVNSYGLPKLENDSFKKNHNTMAEKNGPKWIRSRRSILGKFARPIAITTRITIHIKMKKQEYIVPKSEYDSELYYDVMLCQSPGAGENEGTIDEPLD